MNRTSNWLSRDFFTLRSSCQLLALHSSGLSKVCSALKSQNWKELPLDTASYVTWNPSILAQRKGCSIHMKTSTCHGHWHLHILLYPYQQAQEQQHVKSNTCPESQLIFQNASVKYIHSIHFCVSVTLLILWQHLQLPTKPWLSVHRDPK